MSIIISIIIFVQSFKVFSLIRKYKILKTNNSEVGVLNDLFNQITSKTKFYLGLGTFLSYLSVFFLLLFSAIPVIFCDTGDTKVCKKYAGYFFIGAIILIILNKIAWSFYKSRNKNIRNIKIALITIFITFLPILFAESYFYYEQYQSMKILSSIVDL
jgi:hypothetical protein